MRIYCYRFEHEFIPVDDFFTTLHQCKNLKLERIFLKCDSIPVFAVLPFETFLNAAKQLVFLFIVISKMPKTKLREVQKTLNQYRNRKEQIFHAVQSESVFDGKFPVPDIHKYDMIELNTRVSVLDLFNGFV